MIRRWRFKQTKTFQHPLDAEAKRLREQAKLLPPGAGRNAALRKARQCETGSQLSGWLRSSELQPPE